MKKIFLGVIVFFLLLIAAAYVFIPGKLLISSASSVSGNRDGVYRFLVNDRNWQKWWPGTISKSSQGSLSFRYNEFDFQIKEILYDAIQLNLAASNESSAGLLKVIPLNNDSSELELSSELGTGSDPFNKISAYFHARKLKDAFDEIVLSLKKYAGDTKNIYGISIKKEKVQYQHLVSAKKMFTHYPTTEDVYAIVDKLRNYVNQSGARELFSPMLNIRKADSTTYVAQLGIPVDKELPARDDIAPKWMMKGGNILTAEVTGGPGQVDEATRQMEQYIRDYQRSIIAIPFQMLITDRTREPDSTKWVTRLYYPVV
jgi:hypothetical protein